MNLYSNLVNKKDKVFPSSALLPIEKEIKEKEVETHTLKERASTKDQEKRKKFKIFMNNINLPLHEETCVYTLCKWILADGTQIWLGQQDPDGIFIFYIEPGSRFLVEELNYTGI